MPLKPTDPNNLDSELTPAELGTSAPPDQDETEEAKVKLVDERYRTSSDNRRPREGEWYEGLALYIGNQWTSWSDKSGLISTQDRAKPWRVYETRNKVRPKIKKLLASALRNKPDASVSPLTDAPKDMAAASEGRSALSHLDMLFDRSAQTRRVCKFALTTSITFLKIYWDPTKEAYVPILDAQGQLQGSSLSPVGDIEEDVVPVFEMYLDPKARTWAEVDWLIHAKTRPLSYVQKRYPDVGDRVGADANDGSASYVENRLASITGEYSRGNEPGDKKNVLVKEMWERPSAVYPKGRLLVVANGVLLRDEPWPYKCRKFPFVPLCYEEGQETVYGLNAVTDLKSAQRSYNATISRIQEHRNTAWGKIVVERGANIGADAFDQAKPNEIIYIDRGHQWTHIPAPALPPHLVEILHLDQSDIEDISGVHEVQEGQPPPNVTAGTAIEMLNESDATQLAEFIGNIESYHQLRGEIELSLVDQFYSEQRLVGIQDVNTHQSADPNAMTPLSKVQAFTALSEGNYRVMVHPGSATPKTSSAKAEQLNTMYQMGIFGPPGSPDASVLYLKELEYVRTDALTEQLMAMKEEMKQMQLQSQPNPAQVQQMKGEQAAQAQQMQQQQMQMQMKMDQAHQAQLEAVKVHGQMQLLEAKHTAEIQKMLLDKHMPSVSLSGKLDPTANVDAEHNAGLQGDLAGSKAILTPTPAVKPASGSATSSTKGK